VGRLLSAGEPEQGQDLPLTVDNGTPPPTQQPLTFTDAADIGAAYEGFVRTASEYGVLRGYEDGSFGPQRHTTRREACVVIYRLIAQ